MSMKVCVLCRGRGRGSTTVTQKEELLNAPVSGCYGADNGDNSQINN